MPEAGEFFSEVCRGGAALSFNCFFCLWTLNVQHSAPLCHLSVTAIPMSQTSCRVSWFTQY